MYHGHMGNGIEDGAELLARRIGRGLIVGTNPTSQDLTVTYSGGSWDRTLSQVSAARAAGGKVTWVGTTVLPTQVDGLADGDTVTGTFTPPLPTEPLAKLDIPTQLYPALQDQSGVTNDRVKLWGVPGITWNVAGVDYASYEQIPGSTDSPTPGSILVNTNAASSVVVSASVSDPSRFQLLNTVPPWTLTFDTTIPATTPITIDAGSVPTATDNGGVSVYGSYVTLTSVPNTIWTVDGVDYPSSAWTGTKKVTYLKGTATNVTVRPTGPEYSISGTASWSLMFTNTAGTATPSILYSSTFNSFVGQSWTGASNAPISNLMDAQLGGTVQSWTLKGASGNSASVNSAGSFMIAGLSTTVYLANPATGSRGIEFNAKGNGTSGSHGMFAINIGTNDTKGIRIYIDATTMKMQTGTAYTWADLGASATVSATSSRVGVFYDAVKKYAYLTKDGAVVSSAAYDPGTFLYGPLMYSASGNYSNAIDDVIVFGV